MCPGREHVDVELFVLLDEGAIGRRQIGSVTRCNDGCHSEKFRQ